MRSYSSIAYLPRRASPDEQRLIVGFAATTIAMFIVFWTVLLLTIGLRPIPHYVAGILTAVGNVVVSMLAHRILYFIEDLKLVGGFETGYRDIRALRTCFLIAAGLLILNCFEQ